MAQAPVLQYPLECSQQAVVGEPGTSWEWLNLTAEPTAPEPALPFLLWPRIVKYSISEADPGHPCV